MLTPTPGIRPYTPPDSLLLIRGITPSGALRLQTPPSGMDLFTGGRSAGSESDLCASVFLRREHAVEAARHAASVLGVPGREGIRPFWGDHMAEIPLAGGGRAWRPILLLCPSAITDTIEGLRHKRFPGESGTIVVGDTATLFVAGTLLVSKLRNYAPSAVSFSGDSIMLDGLSRNSLALLLSATKGRPTASFTVHADGRIESKETSLVLRPGEEASPPSFPYDGPILDLAGARVSELS